MGERFKFINLKYFINRFSCVTVLKIQMWLCFCWCLSRIAAPFDALSNITLHDNVFRLFLGFFHIQSGGAGSQEHPAGVTAQEESGGRLEQ